MKKYGWQPAYPPTLQTKSLIEEGCISLFQQMAETSAMGLSYSQK